MAFDTPDLPSPDAALGNPHVAVQLPPSEDGASFAAWQTHLSFACHITLDDPADIAAFQAHVEMYFLGKFVLLQSGASHPHHMVRTGEDVARSGVDLMQISLLLDGNYEGSCSGQPYHAGPGDISFIDYGLPFDFRASPFAMIALLVPRSAMPPALTQRSLHGFVPAAQRPATRLLANLIRETFASISQLTALEAGAAAAAMLDLADGLSQRQHGSRPDASPAKLDLFSRAQSLIERLLEDDELSVVKLAALLNTSRSALYGVFVPHGGVKTYVRERRLQRCYEILKSHDRPADTIGAIAFSLGFGSEAHFSRAFKERFGLSPRALRQASRHGGGNVAPSTADGVAPNVIQMLGR